MTLPATQAMIQGSVDIVPSCHAEHVAAIKNAPNLISLSSLDLFKGFIFVGRKSQWKSFDDLQRSLATKRHVKCA